MNKTILHCDMNGFFASVELLDHPELVKKPMAVAGDPKNRHGIILAKNEIAKAYGVVTAETISSAMRKCPDLCIVPPHHDKYRKYSEKINQIYLRYTDLVEPFSIDESWLDVTASRNICGNGVEIADDIRRTVKEELGLTLSVGVSYNKIFAKMGSDYKKPDATTEITVLNYKRILWPLPVEEMFFVGKKTADKLKRMGINTIGELALSNEAVLKEMLGKQGQDLLKYANGLDDSEVSPYSEREKIKSVGNGITFTRDLQTEDDVLTAVTGISDLVAFRLRKYKMKCKGVKVDIKDSNFNTVSRQRKLNDSVNTAQTIKRCAFDIIKCSEFRNMDGTYKPIRLITITAIGLVDENVMEQLSIFSENNDDKKKEENIERTMDKIRDKYGKDSISFGQIIGNDLGIDKSKED